MRNPRAIRITNVGLVCGIVIIIISAIAGCSDVQDNAAVPTLMSLSSDASGLDVVEKSASEPLKIESPQLPGETSAIIQPGADSIPSEQADSTSALSETTAILQSTAPAMDNTISMETNAGSGPPVIVTQPANQTILSGGTATLMVEADGTEPFTYQWYEGISGDTSTPVGTDSPSYTTPALTTSTRYWVRITNAPGSVNSATATISLPEVSITQITNSTGVSENGEPVFNADGTRIYFLSALDLVGKNADGSVDVFLWTQNRGFRQLSEITGPGLYEAPTSNADGRYVLVASERDLENDFGTYPGFLFEWDEIFLDYYDYDTEGSFYFLDTANLGHNPVLAHGEEGAGACNHYIFRSISDPVGANPDGNEELFLDPCGEDRIQITDTTGDAGLRSLSINSDATRVAFISSADLTGDNPLGEDNLFLWDRTTGLSQITLTASLGEHAGQKAYIAGDGTRIVFASTANLTGGNADGNPEIFLWDEVGGISQIISTTAVQNRWPNISQDGMRVAFLSSANLTGHNGDGNGEVFIWDAATGFSQMTDTTGADVTDAPITINDDGYRVAIRSSANLTGSNADGNVEIFLITPGKAPEVDVPPADQTLGEGGSTTLEIRALGRLPLNYQWYEGPSGDTSTPVGSNSPLLTVEAVQATGQYWARVSNDQGVVDSDVAVVTVYPAQMTCNIAQLTGTAGIESEMTYTISGDGSVVALSSSEDLFGDNPGHELRHYLWDFDSGATAIPYMPEVLNYDGTRFAFFADEDLTGDNPDGNTEVFHWDSGAITQVTDATSNPVWETYIESISDNGSRILLISDVDFVGQNSDGNKEVFLWDESSGLTQITSTDIEDCGRMNVDGSLSGDGTRAAIFTDCDLTGDKPDFWPEIYLWDELAGFTRVTDAPEWIYWLKVAINVDGTRIGFPQAYNLSGRNPDGYPEYYLWDEATGMGQVTASTSYLTFEGFLSGSGHQALLISDADLTGDNPQHYYEVFWWDETQGFYQISPTGTHEDEYQDVRPIAISYDGSRLLLHSEEDLTGDNPDYSTETFIAGCGGPATIIHHPADQDILSGQTAALSVDVIGTAPFTYQWYKGAVGDTSTLVGTDSPDYVTPALYGSTQYWVRITNALGSVDSTAATVTVTSSFCGGVSEIPNSECMALEALYVSTTGTGWTDNTDWMDTNTPCDWYGVGCNTGHITEIDLENNQLTGAIPPELGNLTNLELLDLKDNQLTGTIPPELGSLANLVILDLDNNQLSGTIPPELGDLTNLEGLFVYGNQLTGSIPPELSNLTQLWQLLLAGNQLSGEIPPELGNLSNLWLLGLDHNQLTGTIPVELTNPSNIFVLGLGDNNLTGTIPPELSNLSDMTILLLNGNQLTGTIPPELGDLPNLEILLLQDNQLTGTIPSELGDLATLETLLLQNNALEGEIPASLINLTNLVAGPCDLTIQLYPWSGNECVNFGYNTLYTTSPENPNYQDVIDFLDVKDSDWAQTQTVAPTNVQVDTETMDSVTLSWMPIPYTVDGGYYEVSYGTTSGGPYDTTVQTADKLATGITINGLSVPPYYFVVRAYTPAHGDQQNALYSDYSTEVESTLGISAFCLTVSEIPALECAALEALYASTNGVSWFSHTGWMDTTTPCSWYGVTCETDHVTKVQFWGNNLNGTIPDEIGNLSHLQYLTLAENPQLTGTIPATIGNLTELEGLGLQDNALTGVIPSTIGNLTHLQTLLLDDNQLTGSIPSVLGDLTDLNLISLSGNALSGAIPSSLGNLSNLGMLYLENNQLSGSIPPELGSLDNVMFLYLYNNQLTGPIPPELGDMALLSGLALDKNQLSGTIPPELGDLLYVGIIGLSDNNLTGTIPPELGDVSTLGWLMLNGNQLTGTIPPELGDLPNLEILLLHDNRLTGTIPAELGNITGLETLLLQNNALEGEIPASITNLINLGTVDHLSDDLYPWSGDDEVDFGYNALYTTSPANPNYQDVIDFLDIKDTDWADTQTVPPTNIQVDTVTMDSVTLSWNPIPYTGDGGYYQIYYAQNIAGPYTLHGSTLDKSVLSYQATSLLLGTTYYFQVLTYTPMHGDQQNNLYSDFSPAIEATTLTLSTFCEGVTEIPQTECQALVSLYTETGGAGWTDNTNWLDTFTPCDWYGVGCATGHVDQIDLEDNNLTGTIPSGLSDLVNLDWIYLSNNHLVGNIPATIGDIATLRLLFLDNNQLTGAIPAQLGNLDNLEMLGLHNNQLTGSIPPALGNMDNLLALYLFGNQLNGAIPSQLGSLSTLVDLELFGNQLGGDIPSELGNLTNLTTLLLNGNHLTGSIPASIANLTQLEILLLQDNQLTGSIPTELGSMGNLETLLIRNNALLGDIPDTIVNLTELGTAANLQLFNDPSYPDFGSDEVDFGYNKLYSPDLGVTDFLNAKDPDWAQTQTILPDNIQVDTVTVDSITLTWDPISYIGDGGFYEVHYATTPGGPYTLHGQTPSKYATGYVAGSLLPGTTYYFVVRTYTPAHGSQQNALTTDFGAEVIGTTELMGLNAPTNLLAVAVSQTQIDLSWVDNSSDETAFLLQRSLTGVSDWEDIPALEADTTTYADSGLTCHTRYYYRVRAYRDGDGQTSAFSNIASAVTNLCPAPDAPTNLTATPASLTEISLSWVDNSDETTFHIERSLYGVNWVEIATVPAEQINYTNGGLACSATFRYRVRAYRAEDGQYSDYSSVVVGSTQVCLPPNQPGLYSVTGTGIDRIRIVWADNSIDETAFMVEHSPNGSSDWEQIAMLPANQNSYTHIGLPCNTPHYYRVRAYRNRDSQYSIYSVVMGTSTQACPPATIATVGLYQNGFWQFRDSNSTGSADLHFAFGLTQPNWIPVVGDWDGDGVDGIGVYKDGMWMLRNGAASGQPDLAFIFNPLGTGAIPVVGDWNRDGIDTIGVFKDGMWALRDSNSGGNYDHAFIFNPAGAGAMPITGDWDGDGIDTAGIYKNSAWYLNNSHTSVDRAGGFIYGPEQSSNWLPVIGDWNKDGIDSIGLYRDGIWRLRNSNSAGAPDIGFVFGDGYTGWKPVAGYRGGVSGLMALGLSEVWVPAEPTLVPSPTLGDEGIPVLPTSTPLPTIAPESTETVEPTATAIPPTNTPESTATPVLPTATPIPETTSEPSGD